MSYGIDRIEEVNPECVDPYSCSLNKLDRSLHILLVGFKLKKEKAHIINSLFQDTVKCMCNMYHLTGSK